MNAMRWLLSLLAGAGLLGFAGCKSTPQSAAAPKTAPAGSYPSQPDAKVIVTPGAASLGRVASVNLASQFVVITFPGATLPVPEQKLSVFRQNLKVGEVRICDVRVAPEHRGRNLVADIVAGQVAVGDEVRVE